MGLPALVSKENPGAFGPYELVEQLGQGGMAIVYRARQRGASGFSRDVVLKAMLPALVKSAPLVEMFETEARLTAQLRHPNIVQVEDYGVAGGIPYLIMEFLDGKNLSQLRNTLNKQKQRVPIGAAVSIVRDLCLALGYAHHFVDAEGKRMQVIHRDISPSNVMVLRDGSIRLLDFGVAKLSVEAGQAVTTSLKGKFAYMAPEQVNQEPIDRRCDVFAAGIVLHELLTGKRLFGTRSELETLRRVSAAEAAPPSVLNKDVPPALDALVMRALSREREDRFDSGTEMAAALEQLKLAHARREIATMIGDIFPVVRTRKIESVAQVQAELDGDTEISQAGGDEPLDGVTAPERAVSAPHLVLLPGDSAIVDDIPELGGVPDMSVTGRDAMEMEAEPSAIRAAPTSVYKGSQAHSNMTPIEPRPAAGRRVSSLFDDDHEDRITKKQTAAKKPEAKPNAKPDANAKSHAEAETVDAQRSFPAAETVAAPLDEIRPTRIYDPAKSPAIARVRESDFEQRPTSVFDAAEAVASARATVSGETPDRAIYDTHDAPVAPVVVSPSISVAVEAESARIVAAPSAPATAENSMFNVPPETTVKRASVQISIGPAKPQAGSAFEEEPPPTVQPQLQPKARSKSGSIFLIGGLLGALVVVGGIGARAYLRRAKVDTSAGARSGPPATSPAAAAPSELTAPTVEPRLPSSLPQPLPAADGVSLVGLDRKSGERKTGTSAATSSPADRPAKKAEPAEKTPRSERAERPAKPPVTTTSPPGEERSEVREARPTKPVKPNKPKGSVKEGRIVDPFEDGE